MLSHSFQRFSRPTPKTDSNRVQKLFGRWGKKTRDPRKSRVSRFEQLESRRVLAAAIWNNVLHPVNVNGDADGFVTPIDALLVINELNSPRFSEPTTGLLPSQLPDLNPLPETRPFLDVNCSGFVTPLDALLVINHINAGDTSTGAMPGSGGVYESASCSPRLLESDSFVSELTQVVTLPDDSTAVRVLFEAPSFDTTTKHAIRDAFEIEITDTNGNPVSFPYQLERDAIYNWSENLEPQFGAGTSTTTAPAGSDSTATINLNGVAAGTQLRVTTRLVNNDLDEGTSVIIRGIELVDAPSPAPTGVAGRASRDAAVEPFELSQMTDISGSFSATYGGTSLSGDDNRLSTSLMVTNLGSQTVNGRLIVAIDRFSELDAAAMRPDGMLADGRPYFDLSHELAGDPLEPGETLQSREIEFLNNSGNRFTYRLTAYGLLNAAPSLFDSVPLTSIEAGKTLRYQANAIDPDNQPLIYSLETGPENASIDPDSGELSWSTTGDDVGSHRVTIRATDPHGLFVEQNFVVEVLASLQNRPPNFVSDPVTEAIASSGFEITTVATGAQPAGVDVISGFRGPRLVTANAGDQTIGVYAGENNDRFDDATSYSTGFPAKDGQVFDAGYGVNIGLPEFLHAADSNAILGIDRGDLNNDGNLDLAVLYAYDSLGLGERYQLVITALLGDGDGGFSAPKELYRHDIGTSIYDTRNLLVRDFNGDGALDVLAIERRNDPRLITILGNGDGSFQPALEQRFIDDQENTVAVSDVIAEDIDNDGILDLVGRTAVLGFGANYALVSLHGLGDGTFDEPTFIGSGGSAPNCCYQITQRPYDVADLNQDGNLDLVSMGTASSGDIQIFHGDGTGAFALAVELDPPGSFSSLQMLLAADFTGDELVDFYFADGTNFHLYTADNASGTAYTYSEQTTAIKNSTLNVAGSNEPVDVDGDGDLDFVFGDYFNRVSARVALNDGSGNFSLNEYMALDFSGEIDPFDYGSGVQGALFGDFNSDGVMDLVYATRGTDFDGVGIRLGTRPGEFGSTRTTPWETPSSNDVIHPGDFDGDGIYDLLDTASDVTVLGNGDGSFGDFIPASGVRRPSWVAAVADYNKDGLDDVVAGRAGGLYVGLSNGDGTFAVNQMIDGGGFYGYNTIDLADFNQDGFMDFIVKNEVSEYFEVYLNDSLNPGTFSMSFTYALAPGSQGVNVSNWEESWDVADFTGDGIPDLLTAEREGGQDISIRAVVFAGDGTGDFTRHSDLPVFEEEKQVGIYGSAVNPGDFATGDIDEDGDLDVLAGSTIGTRILLNDGAGNFSSDGTLLDHPRFNQRGRDSWLVDFDKDGHLDYLVADAADVSGTILFWRGDGQGNFELKQSVDMHAEILAIREPFIDWDNDGYLDLLYATGEATSEEAAFYMGRRDDLVDLVAVDLDGDGNEEILAIQEQMERLQIFQGDNLGGFTRLPDLQTGRAPKALTVADLNDDGRLELLVANRAGRSITVYSGSLETDYTSSEYPIASQDVLNSGPIDIISTDIDGDGRMDVLVLDDTANAIWFFQGDGTSVLGEAKPSLIGDRPGSFVVADVDNDDQLDTVIALPETNRLMILPSFGKQSSRAPLYIDIEGKPSDVVALDLNNDGLMDIVTTLPDRDIVSIHYGMANNQFARAQEVKVGRAPTSLTMTDADEDGRTDLVVANSGDDTVSVIYNRFDPNGVYRYDSDAIDPDDDTLTYSIQEGPGGLIINSSTGELLWAASPDQVGVHDVTLAADDGRGGVATQSFKIEVEPARENAAPLIASEPLTEIGAGDNFSYQVQALDGDDHPLRFSLIEGPEGATIDATTGELIWDGRSQSETFGIARQGGIVRIPADESLKPESITIEGWYELTNLPRFNTLVNDQGITVTTHETDQSLRVDVNLTGDFLRFFVPITPKTERWYHIAFTYDASIGEAKLFVDGQFAGSDVANEPIPLNTTPGVTTVGLQNGNTTANLDNYRIWNYARGETEIQEGLSLHFEDDPRLLVDFRFEETDTISVRDYSIYGNHGYRINLGTETQTGTGLAEVGNHDFRIRVEDGRGGIDEQTFTLEISPELRGSIVGQLFDDLNGDGDQDDGSEAGVPAEPALAGWHLFIDDNNNGYPDPHESQATTDSNGQYHFEGLLPSSYPVSLSPVAGYKTPAEFNASVEPGIVGELDPDSVVHYDLAIEQLSLSQIRGQLLTEENDTIAYWKAYADLNDNGSLDDDEPRGMSDRNGNYAITGLDAGTYTIRTERPAGWTDDTEREGLTVTIANDEISSGHDFTLSPTNTSVTGGLHFVTTPGDAIEAGQTFRYASIAIGIHDEAITYDLSLAPEGMTIDPQTGLTAWRPTLDQVGEHLVILRATSETGSIALHDFSLQVAAPNTPPVLSVELPTVAYVDRTFAIDLQSQDAESDELTFELLSGPTAASLDSISGELRWLPQAADVGSVAFEIEIRDARGASQRVMFDVEVLAETPTTTPFETNPIREKVGVGQGYVAQLTGTDALGRPLSWSFVQGPESMTLSESAGLQWTPSGSDLGTQTIQLRADDPDGFFEFVFYEIEVVGRPVGSTPQITSTPVTSAVIDNSYTYQIVAADDDFDPLAYALLQSPVGMSIHPSLGTVLWTPTNEQIGESEIIVQVSDSDGRTTEQSFDLKVSRFGGPPSIISTPPTEASIGAGYLYTVDARDLEGDPLNYRLLAAPQGMTITESTGEIAWTPSAEQLGEQEVVIEVSDGIGGASTQAFVVRVSDGVPNFPPRIISTAPRLAVVGQVYSYDPLISDLDSTVFTYSLGQSPEGMTIGSESGAISWTPSSDQVGRFVVTIIVTDDLGASGIESYEVDVLAENSQPNISSTPPTEATIGAAFAYQVLAQDADRDPLEFRLTTAPGGASIDAFGRIQWVPLPSQIGEASFEVLVTDPRGGEARQSFSVAVVEDTEGPRVSLIERPNDANRNILPWMGPFVVYAKAIDNVEVASLTLTANGRDIPLDAAGNATFTFEDWTFSTINATATAIDTSGNESTRTISFSYDFPEGWSGAGTEDIPTAEISSPTEAEAVFGMVSITGTADHEDFFGYKLSYRRADETNFTEFYESTTPVTNGELGVWDTSLLLNDEYVIRLEVATNGGIVNVAEHNVGLSGNLKLGDFQLEFTDLIVPIANAQIEFTRVYDTLQSDNQGDFGHGWRLEYRDTDLHVGLPASGLEDIGIYPALRPGVKVYLNLPGEGRIGFTFDPDIRVLPGWGGNNLVLARPRFTADRGVNATLSTGISNYLHVNEFGELMAPGGIPYNPASPSFGGAYVVKTSDGTSYRIDGASGELLNIQDSAGNMVSFADDGIYDGQRRVLSFVRNSAGRITQVLDPIGANIQYRYSPAGDLIGVTDRAGNESRYMYDDTRPHFLKDYVDPNNQRVVRNEYSDDGRLVRQVDASGESTAISYDIGNRLVIVADELGNETALEYDNRGLLVAQTDALGNTTRREYDENGNQIRLIDATGAEARSTFNQFGSQTSLTDALGNVTRWTYDQFGNTLTEVSPTGLLTSATFDDRGLQTSMTNASGGQTQFTLNAFGETETVGLPTYTSMQFGYENGLPVSITDSDDADVKISYDDLNQPTRIADLNSGTSFDVEYDANGNLTSVTDVFGAVITYEYDANGNVIATEDALGNRTTYQYDPAGRLIQTTYADGLYESNEYDIAGRLVQKQDRAGYETRYFYDAVGRVITIIEPDLTPNDPIDNPRINYEYDAVGRMTASINQLGARTEYQYDAIGNLIRTIDPMGGETIRRYNGESRLVETIDPVERRTLYGYDASGNQESLELNDGSIFVTEHDRNGLPLRATDAAGVTRQFQYGPYGRLLAVVEAHGAWTYSYDQAGFLASTTDPRGNTTSFVNDAMGRVVEKTFPDGRTESYAYDLAGNLISRTQPDGGKITFDYDQLNRQTTVQYPDGSTIATVYTANGLVQAVEEADARTTFQYDAVSRETSRIDPNGSIVSTEYDLAGNKISTTSLAGATIYGYDANNRLISVEFGEDTTRYYYNAAGDLRRTEYSNGVYETLSWSDAGRIHEKSIFDSTDQLLEHLTYAYDAAGRILSTSYLDGKVQAFEYNSSGWHVTETTMVGISEESRVEHRYDANGNRINQIDSASGVREFEYDKLNRVARETTDGIVILYEYDSNGNLTSKTSSNGDQTTHQWDKAGRLLSVTTTVGETSNTVSYEYSPDGELMSRKVNGVIVYLIVDTAREYPQTLAETTESETIETAYVLPAYDRGVIAQYQDTGEQVLHSDAGYSTIVVTDTSGSVSDRISYTGYGEVSNRDGTSNIKHLYNGEFRDNITGLDYLRARNYDPNVGRFISADPFPGLTVDPITMNSYAYASADPINHTDPSGNITTFEMKVVLGINMTLFGIGGAALGYKIAEYKEVNPIAGAIIGGITGAAVGFGATVAISYAITAGGITAFEATPPLLTAEVLVPIGLIDVSSAFALAMSTFGLLSIADIAKTYGIFKSLLDQSGTVPGSNVPLSSLTPQAIVEVREPGGK